MPLPAPNDYQGWTKFISRNDWTDVSAEEMCAAVRLIPRGSMELIELALLIKISRAMASVARRFTKRHALLNQGEDVVDQVTSQLLEALTRPNHHDGASLCLAFWYTVKLRTLDSIRNELVSRKLIAAPSPSDDGNKSDNVEVVDPNAVSADELPQLIDFKRIYMGLSDLRRHKAFILRMKGLGLAEIANTLDVGLDTTATDIATTADEIREEMNKEIQR